MDTEGNELSTYSIEGSTKKIRRISDRSVGWVSLFSSRVIDASKSFGEYMAGVKWGSRSHDHRLDTELGTNQSYEEFRDAMDANMTIGQLKGRIMHLFLKRDTNKHYHLGISDAEIVNQINNQASLSGGQLTPRQFEWLMEEKNLTEIYRQAGMNRLMN
ncbi:MAG: hypothetical protein HC875_36720, partial [Anaerolineales bacterium]|nr:hypothetical protein [Anaerolineales bacterium]